MPHWATEAGMAAWVPEDWVQAQQAILILSNDHVKSARSIYQQLELAVARSSMASAQAAFSFKLPSLTKSWPPQDADQGQNSKIHLLWCILN